MRFSSFSAALLLGAALATTPMVAAQAADLDFSNEFTATRLAFSNLPKVDQSAKPANVTTFSGFDSVPIGGVKREGQFLTLAPSQPATPSPAPAPAPAPAPSAGGNPSEPQFVEVDTDNNGKPDLWGADRNGDGNFDIVLLDQDGDGQPDIMAIDENFNGVAEVMWMPDVTVDGQVMDIFVFDENEDGTPDFYGLDTNQDGTPDNYVQA